MDNAPASASDTAPTSPNTSAPESAAPVSQTAPQSQSSAQAPASAPAAPSAQATDAAPQSDASTQEQVTTENKEGDAKTLQGGVLDAYAQTPVTYEFKGADGNAISDGNTQIVAGLAQDLGLSPEQAQKLYDSGMGADGVVAKINRQALESYNQAWAQEIQSDPELGGGNLEMTKHNVAKAMAVADNDLKDFLSKSGLGNFPPLVRYLNKVGKQLHSDMDFIGNRAAPAQEEKDWAALLYDHSPNLR